MMSTLCSDRFLIVCLLPLLLLVFHSAQPVPAAAQTGALNSEVDFDNAEDMASKLKSAMEGEEYSVGKRRFSIGQLDIDPSVDPVEAYSFAGNTLVALDTLLKGRLEVRFDEDVRLRIKQLHERYTLSEFQKHAESILVNDEPDYLLSGSVSLDANGFRAALRIAQMKSMESDDEPPDVIARAEGIIDLPFQPLHLFFRESATDIINQVGGTIQEVEVTGGFVRGETTQVDAVGLRLMGVFRDALHTAYRKSRNDNSVFALIEPDVGSFSRSQTLTSDSAERFLLLGNYRCLENVPAVSLTVRLRQHHQISGASKQADHGIITIDKLPVGMIGISGACRDAVHLVSPFRSIPAFANLINNVSRGSLTLSIRSDRGGAPTYSVGDLIRIDASLHQRVALFCYSKESLSGDIFQFYPTPWHRNPDLGDRNQIRLPDDLPDINANGERLTYDIREPAAPMLIKCFAVPADRWNELPPGVTHNFDFGIPLTDDQLLGAFRRFSGDVAEASLIVLIDG